MLHITPQEQIEEYFQSTDLNQSTLKKIEEDFSSVHQEGDYNKPWFVTGSAVDLILTGEEGSFEKTYYVSASEKLPSPAVTEILDCVYQKLIEDYNEYVAVTVSGLEVKGAWQQLLDQEVVIEENLMPQTHVSTFVEFVGRLGEIGSDNKTWSSPHATYLLDAASAWNPNYGPQAKLNNLIPPGMQYFNDLVTAYPKKIISSDHKAQIDAVVLSLRSHSRTAKYFDREFLQSELMNDVDVFYQFPIYFEVEGIKCKALLDMVIVERSENGAPVKITPIDLKTMSGNTYDFIHSLKKRRYDIQGAWYTEACIQKFQLESLATAVMQPFTFIVESSDKPGKPLVYQMSPELLRIGQVGMQPVQLVESNLFSDIDNTNITTNIKEGVLGYTQLVDLYNFHQQNGWDEEKEIKQAKGLPLLLGWDGIINQD